MREGVPVQKPVQDRFLGKCGMPDPPARSTVACRGDAQLQAEGMFIVDEATAEAIRRAWHEGGELSGVVELRRHFPLITDNAKAQLCVRTIVGWAPRPVPKQEQR